MLLAFNLGNTEIAFGVWDTAAPALRFTAGLAAHPARTPDEYAVLLAQIFALHNTAPADITDVIIASVVPSLTDAVVAATARLTPAKPAIVGPGMRTGLQMRIDTPAQLGADLVALAAAAKAADATTPAVIAALETATTLTVLDAAGAIAGVIILPGLGSSAAALERDTALLTQIPLTPPRRVIGRNTVESMRAGLFYGEAARIDGLLDRICAELGTDTVNALATGRYAAAVAPLCRRSLALRPTMLQEGLLALWQLNAR